MNLKGIPVNLGLNKSYCFIWLLKKYFGLSINNEGETTVQSSQFGRYVVLSLADAIWSAASLFDVTEWYKAAVLLQI